MEGDGDMAIENYQLWYEYLKRSKNFRIFCDWVYDKKIDLLKLSYHPARGENPLPERYNSTKHYLDESKDLPGVENFINQYGTFNHIVACYFNNGDIFRNVSFDEWYRVRQAVLNAPWANSRTPAVKVQPFSIPHYDAYSLFVRIRPDAPDELVIKQIKQILKEYRKDDGRLLHNSAIIWLRPSSRVRRDVLNRCILVHDLTEKGFKIKQIIQKIGTPQEKRVFDIYSEGAEDGDPETDSIIRKFLQYRITAKEIIGNVERGYFPRNMMDKK